MCTKTIKLCQQHTFIRHRCSLNLLILFLLLNGHLLVVCALVPVDLSEYEITRVNNRHGRTVNGVW